MSEAASPARSPVVAGTPAGPIPPTRPSASPVPRTGKLDDRGVVRHDSVHAAAWRARGAVKIEKEADAGVVRLDGTVTVGGDLTADSLTTNGSLEVGGRIEIDGVVKVDGSLRTIGAMHAVEGTFRGTVKVGGRLTVDRRLAARGLLVAASVQGNAVTLEGAVDVPGEITAQSLDAVLDRDSRLGAVRARSVVLRGKVPNLVEKVLQRAVSVTVDRVEADTVSLEGVDVEFVRSPALVLGRDCHVTMLEGTVVGRHPTSDIGPRSKSAPPYGLRR